MSGHNNSDNVRVIVRCRPFNQRESNNGDYNIVFVDKELGQVQLQKPDTKNMNGEIIEQKIMHKFTFDAAYGEGSTQIEIFDESVRPMILFVMQGYNSTVFAYGQTGSGKTHTMMGYTTDRGMIPQGIQLIFDEIAKAPSDKTYLVRCSFYEIYNEQIRDLMTNALNIPLKETKEKGVYIEGLTEYEVNSEREIDDLMVRGNAHRSTAATNMNATSSRSHSIFQIVVECATEDPQDQRSHICVGRLNLVDLAGSERVEKTGATGQRFKEGTRINLSLSNLGQVIQKLVDGDDFIPYRASKLTHILKDSLGGNAKTLMVVAISPASTNYEETHSSLRYADRAKRIKNKARINEDPKDAQIREMRERIAMLEEQLARYLQNSNGNLTDEQKQNIVNIQQQLSNMQRFRRKVVVKNNQNELNEQMSEQQRLERELREKQLKADKTRQFVEEMERKIQQQKLALQKKEELENQALELERQERIARQQLAEQRQQQMLLKRQLLEQEQRHQNDVEQIQTIQQQKETLKKKLQKYKDLEIQATNELSEIQKENARDLQIRQQDFDDLKMLYKQKRAVLRYFIPDEYYERVKKLAQFDDEREEWMIAGQEDSGNAQRGFI